MSSRKFLHKGKSEECRIIKVGHSQKDEGGVDNTIRTSKYTIWSFFPVAIGEQFRRTANMYFLVLGCIMLIGSYTSIFSTAVSPWTIIGPLVIVISVSLVQEGIADIARHRSDRATNTHPCYILDVFYIEDELNEKSKTTISKTADYVTVDLLTKGHKITIELEKNENGNRNKLAIAGLQSVMRSKIYAGNLVLVRNREMIPADMVLLASSVEGGSAYIETSSIDGETNLKQRSTVFSDNVKNESIVDAIKRLVKLSALGYPNGRSAVDNPIRNPQNQHDSTNALSSIKPRTSSRYSYRGFQRASKKDMLSPSESCYIAAITSEVPNASVNTYSGSLTVPPPDSKSSSPIIPLGPDHLLLRGAVLRNTEWLIGVAVFTGTDTKLVKNSVKTPSKFSRLDQVINKTVIMILFVMIIVIVVCSRKAVTFHQDHFRELWYLGFNIQSSQKWPYLNELDAPEWDPEPSNFGQMVMLFFTIFSNFVPLSLYVTVELTTFFFMHLIGQDIEMYHPETDTTPIAKSTIVTDLGQVKYIFSDKTGTLTQNIMKFKRCSVDGKLFGAPVLQKSTTEGYDELHETTHDLQELILEPKEVHKSMNAQELYSATLVSHQPLSFNTEMFLRVMCLCHSVVVGEDFDDDYKVKEDEDSFFANAWNNFKSQVNSVTASTLLTGSKKGQLKQKKSASGKNTVKAPNEKAVKKQRSKETENFEENNVSAELNAKSKDGAPQGFTYRAESPDEAALVQAASLQYGYQLINNSSSTITIQRFSNLKSIFDVDKGFAQKLKSGELSCSNLAFITQQRQTTLENHLYEERWKVLALNKFESDRKRMSVLFRSPANLGSLPILFCKGADSSMLNKDVCEGFVDADAPFHAESVYENDEEIELVLSKHSNGVISDHGFLPEQLISINPYARENDYEEHSSIDINEFLGSKRESVKIYDKASDFNMSNLLNIQQHLGEFAKDGLRTLVLGVRVLTEEECENWMNQYNKAASSIKNRAELLSEAAKSIEKKLHIVGATAIEDKLQDGVPETIANLAKADIKLWVCTGDKRETAIEIGYSTKVLTPKMHLTQIIDSPNLIYYVAKEFLHLVKKGKLPQYQKSALQQNEGINTFYYYVKNMLKKLIVKISKCYWLLTCFSEKDQDDQSLSSRDAMASTKKRNKVRELAEEIVKRHKAKGISESSSDHKPPSVFQRGKSAKAILDFDQSTRDFHNSKISKLSYPSGEMSQSLVSYSESYCSLPPHETSQFDDAKRSIFERLFAVDQDVRHGELKKHLNKETLAALQSSYKDAMLDELHDDSKALILEGAALTQLLGNDTLLEEMLFSIASTCQAVIACRVSPKQKALLVKLVQTYVVPAPVTLAIGDGANDVGMIQAAHVGIGISGLEGQQAVNSSDFAIAQFRFLERLLLIHGRWNFYRMAKLALFSFYKNAVLCGVMVIYQGQVLYSGIPLFDQWIISMYNFVVTIPIMVVAFFDRDLEPDYIISNPEVYAPGPSNEYMSIRVVLRWVCITIIHILGVYYLARPSLAVQGMQTSAWSGLMWNRADPGDGEGDLKTFGTIIYTILVIMLGFKVLFESHSIITGVFPYFKCCTRKKEAWYNRLPWTWVGLIFGSWGFWIFAVYVYSVVGRTPNVLSMVPFVNVAMQMYNMQSISWIIFLLVPLACCVLDVAGKTFSNLYFPTQTHIHAEIATIKERRKKEEKKKKHYV